MNLFRFLFRDPLFGYYSAGAFAMSFLSEVGLLIANTLIVNKLGAAEYATMYFWAILLSMVFYIVFSAFRESAVRVFYGIVLTALFANSIFFHLNESSEIALKAFIVSFLLVDFIGPNVFSGVLIGHTTPTAFREIFQKMLSIQLFARILGSLTMASLSNADFTEAAIYIFLGGLDLSRFQLSKSCFTLTGWFRCAGGPSLLDANAFGI